MNNSRIEKSIKNAINGAPVISAEELFASPYVTMTEHDYITRQEPVRRSSHVAKFTSVAALCLVVLVMISGWYVQNRITDSVITLDVNPSIEIRTNQKNEVIAVKALNEDAAVIVVGQEYYRSKLEDTVAILIDSLVEHSYLSTDKNTILLTVLNKSSQKADDLKNRLKAAITITLNAQDISPTIMSQVIAKEKNQAELAKDYNISQGKLKLILDMINYNDKLTISMLSGMSMEELLELAQEYGMDLSGYLAYDNDDNQEEREDSENSFEKWREDSEDSEQEDSDIEDSDRGKEESDQEDSQEHEYGDEEGQDEEGQDEEDQDEEDQNEEDQNEEDQDEEDQDEEDQDEEAQDKEAQDKEDHVRSKNYENQGDEEEDNSIENSEGKDNSYMEGSKDEDKEESEIGQGDASDDQDSHTMEDSSVEIENADQTDSEDNDTLEDKTENSDSVWIDSEESDNQYNEDSGNNIWEKDDSSSDSNKESENTSENQESEED